MLMLTTKHNRKTCCTFSAETEWSSSSVSWQCGDCWVSFTLSHALVPLDEQRVGFTVHVLLEGHARLLQLGQGASGLAQQLVQRRHSGIDLPGLPLQTTDTGSKWGDRETKGDTYSLICRCVRVCVHVCVHVCVCACTWAGVRPCRAPCGVWGSGRRVWTEQLSVEPLYYGWPVVEQRCSSPVPRSAPGPAQTHTIIQQITYHPPIHHSVCLCLPLRASSPAGSWPHSAPHSAGWRLGPQWSTGPSDPQWCPAALAPPAFWEAHRRYIKSTHPG